MAVITGLLLFLTLVSAPAFAQQPQDHRLSPDQVGATYVKFQTSCAAAVADDFNRGVALYHSFWFPEAIRTFESVLQRDPNCALGHWGIALSQWGNPYAGIKSADVVKRGAATVATAQKTGTPTAREKALIDAIALLYSNPDPATHRDRTLRYEDAMRQVSESNAADTEVRMLYALAVTQTALPTDKTYAKLLQAADMLEPLFVKMPQHPGLAHYLIHAYDAPPLAERALTAARRYASLAPAAPHALHMPSHTFTRLGSWKESIETNLKSADSARADKDPNAELHALDYQTYAYLQIGRDVAAKGALDRATIVMASPGANAFAAAAIPARYALERGSWDAAAELVVRPAPATPYTEAITHFARAIGAARAGRPANATADITRLAELRDRLQQMQDVYWSEQVDIQRRVALAWQAFAAGRTTDGLDQMKAAADAEDATDKAAVTPGPLAPARELYGEMLLAAGRTQESLAAFEATMKKEPGRFRGTYGAARAADAAGDRTRARMYYIQLLEIARDADTQRPELQAARTYTTR